MRTWMTSGLTIAHHCMKLQLQNLLSVCSVQCRMNHFFVSLLFVHLFILYFNPGGRKWRHGLHWTKLWGRMLSYLPSASESWKKEREKEIPWVSKKKAVLLVTWIFILHLHCVYNFTRCGILIKLTQRERERERERERGEREREREREREGGGGGEGGREGGMEGKCHHPSLSKF